MGDAANSTHDKALRGRLLWFVGDPEEVGDKAVRFVEDGLLVLSRGKIVAAGEARALLPTLPASVTPVDHRLHLIMPGFIDPHIHFPQTQVIASYGAQLMEWLNKYTFVAEQQFSDPVHAARVATFFFDELLAIGTTTPTTTLMESRG